MKFSTKSSFTCSYQLFIGVLFALVMAFGSYAQAEPADFTLPDMENKQQKLSDYRGKWVVVNYWATWCPPCLTEIPELVDFHEDHKDKDAVVLGVNFEDIGLEELKRFNEEYFMNYPVLRTKPSGSSALGVIPGLPTTFLVSPEGEIIARQVGPVTAKLINEFINQQKSE